MIKKIFMTGGTGFFGKSLLSMLKRGYAPEYECTILSRDPQGFLKANPEFAGMKQISFVTGDVRDFVFPGGHFDCVLHAGAPAMLMPPGVERDIILRGTEHTLSFAKRCGAEKFMFVSSGAVYGVQPSDLPNIPESFPCNPVTEYGIAKREAEKMCLDSGLFTLLPRCFAFVGPYLNRNIHFAIGNFIGDCLAGRDIIIKGDGTPYRSYLYADELVHWLFTILDRGTDGRPYNVGSPHSLSIRELAEEVSRCFASPPEIRIEGTPVPGAPPARYVPDTTRAQKELGLSCMVPLAEAIRRTAEAVRAMQVLMRHER